jgi:hypothetical protein
MLSFCQKYVLNRTCGEDFQGLKFDGDDDDEDVDEE